MLSSLVRRFLAQARATLRLVSGFSRRWLRDRELDEEVAFHLEQATARNIRRGMNPDDARRDALVRFGGRTRWTEQARDEQRSRWLDDLSRDLRYGIAALRRNPGFAAAAVVTIGLALAATVTVFSFINAIYLRPLAVPEGRRLVRIYGGDRPDIDSDLGWPAYRELRRAAKSFDVVAAHYSTAPLFLAARGESAEEMGAVVSAEYFQMLGIRPVAGRFFRADEDSVIDRDAVAVIGHALWMRRFGGDAGAIGERVTINGRAFTIVGVAPESFDGVVAGFVSELWIPTMMLRTGYRWCDGFQPSCAVTAVIARLAPGATLSTARAEISAMRQSLIGATNPADSIRTIAVNPVTGIPTQRRPQFEALAKLLSAIAIILMSIACANLAGLLLARGLAREREMALRASLGAGRGRIMRQLLTENLLIAALGGALGVLLSLWTSRALVGFFEIDNEGYAHRFDVTIDWRLVVFAVIASGVAALAFGAVPSLRTSRVDIAYVLKAGGGGRAGTRLRSALVAGQVLLCVALLIGAGLLTRSFDRLMSAGTFDPAPVAQVRLRPRLVGYSPEQGQDYVRRAIAEIRAVPGVLSVAPVRGSIARQATARAPVTLPGDAAPSGNRGLEADYFDIGPEFFATLSVPMLAGREFTPHDDASSPLVAMVSESLARRLWGGRGAVGRTLILNGKSFQVVGVVSEYRLRHAGEAVTPTVYIAYWQSALEPQIDARLVIRVAGDPVRALPAIRRAALRADQSVPVTQTLTMAGQMAASYTPVRLGRTVLIVGAALALVLSAVGLYGLVAFGVVQRRREVAVRIAVGARPHEVVALFVRRGLHPIWIGGSLGLVSAVIAAPLLSRWLFGVAPLDGVSIATSVVSVGAVGLLAAYVPARRAAKTNPADVLRSM